MIDERGRPVDPLGDKVKRRDQAAGRRPAELGGERLAVSLLRGNWLYWPSLVFRTERVQSYEFRDGLPIIQDLALVIDMVAAGETLVLDPTVCFSYRRHTASASSTSLLQAAGCPTSGATTRWPPSRCGPAAGGGPPARRDVRGTSRLHALTLLPPGDQRGGRWSSVPTLARHAFGR